MNKPQKKKSLARRARPALVIAFVLCLAAPAAASALNVFAASSLRDVFTQIDAGQTYNFAASNTLQLQIERGADADVFASASPAEPQALFKENKCGRPVTFATNSRSRLRRLGLSRVLTNNTVSGEANVANVVSKVALGSADAGFAYVTDGKIAGDQVTAIRLPRYAQPPVRYQICAVTPSAGATAFINSVRSGRGRSILKAAGFGLPPKG
jgi:molybdate transport system substrate-binding protein